MEIHKTCKKKIGKQNKDLTRDMIVKTIDKLPYKKFIGWCGTIARMREWSSFFKKNFKDFTVYCTSSADKIYKDELNTNFDTGRKSFYECKGNAILLCVNRCREGSDIPYIDCGIYLDQVKKRSILVSIQTSGRVLRKDPEKKKTKGYIIDTFVNDGKIEVEIMTANMLIAYYEKILQLTNDDVSDKINKYSAMRKIFNETTFDETKKTINVKLDDEHQTEINLELITTNFDWEKFKLRIVDIIEKTNKIKMDDKLKLDFIELKAKIKGMFSDKEEYITYAKENELTINPETLYISSGWVNWYDFLGCDISDYPKTMWELRDLVKQYNILTHRGYIKKCKQYNLPSMPEELYTNYKSFTQLL
jgi:hypothetical protein